MSGEDCCCCKKCVHYNGTLCKCILHNIEIKNPWFNSCFDYEW